MMTSIEKTESSKGREREEMDDATSRGYQIPTPRRREVPVNASSEPTEPSSEPEPETPPMTSANAALVKNFDSFHDKFSAYVTDFLRGLLYDPSSGRYLHAYTLKKYTYMNPAWYHPNIAIHDITFETLMTFFDFFNSVNDRSCYLNEQVLEACIPDFERVFEDINCEGTLTDRFSDFTSSVIGEVNNRQYIKKIAQLCSAASGFVAKRVGGEDVVDGDAGYMGKTDSVMYFGNFAGAGELINSVFCAIEFKYLGQPDTLLGHRWYTRSGALLAHVLQSMIGHNAPVALAFTEQGFRVYILRRDPVNTDHFVLCTWPPGPGMYMPDVHNVDASDEGLRVLAQIVRITTRNRESRDQRVKGQLKVSRPQSNCATTEPSSPVSPIVNERRAHPGDKVYKLRTTTGVTIELKSLCLGSRFTEQELLEIDKLELRMERQERRRTQ